MIDVWESFSPEWHARAPGARGRRRRAARPRWAVEVLDTRVQLPSGGRGKRGHDSARTAALGATTMSYRLPARSGDGIHFFGTRHGARARRLAAQSWVFGGTGATQVVRVFHKSRTNSSHTGWAKTSVRGSCAARSDRRPAATWWRPKTNKCAHFPHHDAMGGDRGFGVASRQP